MSVQDNQDINVELEELKEYAKDIGVEFRDNIGLVKLQEKVEVREQEIAEEKRQKKELAKAEKNKKVRIVVEPRERDEGINDQFFGFNSLKTGLKESIQIQFGEEVEVSEAMYNHIKNITYTVKKFKMTPDADGIPRKEWYNKKQTRFIVSKV